MRWFAISLAAWSLLMAPARAQQATQDPASTDSSAIDIQLFRPSPGGTGFLTVEAGDVNTPFGLSAGVSLNYARNPLAIYVIKPDGSEQKAGLVVKNRVNADLLLGLGLFGFFDIGVVLPFVYQSGFDGDSFKQVNVELAQQPVDMTQGDLRIVPKVRFLRLGNGSLSAALVGTVIVPSAQGAAYAGEAGPVIAPSVAISTRRESIRAAFNAGYRFRNKSTQLKSLTFKDEIFGSLAVGLNVGRSESPFEIVGELFGHTPPDNPLSLKEKSDDANFKKTEQARTVLEGDIGLRVSMTEAYGLTLGVGGGILPGLGAPSPRLFASFGYYGGQKGPADGDEDGVTDEFDKCPDKKEDRDGFEDDDGCNEVDNDHDTVADEDDQCPNDAEDKDSFQDENGCPDPDNDEDGFADADDKCPTDAEDKDSFEDEDGCPDLDNDKDGIADTVDKCPAEAEDKDGYLDEDGCLEQDNDNDGMADLNDLCPNNAEDIDKVADDDGCPEDNDGDGHPDQADKCPNEAESYNGIQDEDGCPEKVGPKSLVKVTQEKIEIKDKIFFKTGSAVILPKSFGLLDQVAAVLKNYKHLTKVRVEGHTDTDGNRKRNVKLSRDRAESVRKYLLDKGVEPARLEAEGFGPDKPIASNKSPKGKEMNRRVEFVIAEQKALGVDVAEEAAKEAAKNAPVIEMPGFDSGTPAGAGGTQPASAPAAPGATEQPLFEMDLGGGTGGGGSAAPAPAPAPEPEKGKKKGKKGKKPKKEDAAGGIEFNF